METEETVGEDTTLQAALCQSLATSSGVTEQLLAESALRLAHVLLAVLATDRADAATLVARGASVEGGARQLLRMVLISLMVVDECMLREVRIE